MRTRIQGVVLADNVPTERDARVQPSAFERDGMLVLDYFTPDQLVIAARPGPRSTLFPGAPRNLRAKVPLPQEHLYRKVRDCRQVWSRLLAHEEDNFGTDPYRPASMEWDLRSYDHLLDRYGSDLAAIGWELYRLIFRYRDAQGNAVPALEEIADLLERGERRGGLVLTLHSDTCFVPWGLLYTSPDGEPVEPDGSNWKPEGFWGMRHLLDHQVADGPLPPPLMAGPDGIAVSLNVDGTLDESMGHPVVEPVVRYFETCGLAKPLLVRRTKGEVTKAFVAGLPDRVVYFCCHGYAGDGTSQSTSIRLEDGGLITVDYFAQNLSKPLDSPVVFMNSCQGGQVHARFYQSFASWFLQRGANCVIGAQIDLPAVLAAWYAVQFFERFLAGEQPVGRILQELARTLFLDYSNPLGLVYSAYRGIDARLSIARVASPVNVEPGGALGDMY